MAQFGFLARMIGCNGWEFRWGQKTAFLWEFLRFDFDKVRGDWSEL